MSADEMVEKDCERAFSESSNLKEEEIMVKAEGLVFRFVSVSSQLVSSF